MIAKELHEAQELFQQTGPALIHRMLSDPDYTTSGMLREQRSIDPGLVQVIAVGDEPGTPSPTSQPYQSPSDQTEDVQLGQETPPTLPPATIDENF